MAARSLAGVSPQRPANRFGREVARRLPHGETNWLKYDAFGRLTEAYDFKKQKKVIKYDWLGRVATNFWFETSATYPSNSTEYYYNALGQLTNITERFGTNASSTWAYAPLRHKPDRYIAWLAPLRSMSPETGGTLTGLMISAGLMIMIGRQIRKLSLTGANGANRVSLLSSLVTLLSPVPIRVRS